MQTIVSVEGSNKIVRTNVISSGQTFVVEPTEAVLLRPAISAPTLSPIQPTLLLVPAGPTFAAPTAVPEAAPTIPTTPAAEALDTDTAQVMGNILKPSLFPMPVFDTNIPAEVGGVSSSAPSNNGHMNHHQPAGSDDTDSHVPTMEVLVMNTPTEIMPSIVDITETLPTMATAPVVAAAPAGAAAAEEQDARPLAGEDETSSALDLLAVVPVEQPAVELAGITSVVMGEGQQFTTFITRLDADERTLVTTIANDRTQVNYVEPTPPVAFVAPTVVPAVADLQEATTTATATATAATATTTTGQKEAGADDSIQPAGDVMPLPVPVPDFPADSPFRPRTVPVPVVTRPATRPTAPSTPAAAARPPVVQNVQEDNADNKFVMGGFGGIFGVNQPSVPDACRGQCSKDKMEVCLHATGQHQCVCRPGFSRADPSQACSSTYRVSLISLG